MSIKYNDKTNNREILLAGISPVDQILNGTSKNAIANKAVFNALKEKIDKTVSDLVNYYSKADVYNKAEVRALISTISTMDIQVVNALPTEDISTTTIYFLKPAGATTYDEYVYINNAWVKIGTTDLDLSQYVTNDALTLRLADYYTKAEITTLLTQYAQKDNVYDKDAVDALLDDKQDVLTFDNVPTENSNNVVKSGGVYSAVDDVYKVMGENGAKNLVPYPFYGRSNYTSNGITWTDNGDGTITANGTATADSDFYPFFAGVGTGKLLTLPMGTYTVNGCPLGASSSTYYGYVSLWNDSHTGGVTRGFDYGEGFNLTLDEKQELRGLVFRIVNGQTVTNLTFSPMIRLASDTDDTYQPYAKTNKQLTEDKAEQADVNDIVNVYGAKNLLPNTFVAQTVNGITFTANSDGSITANGTATALTSLAISENIALNGDYILNGCPSGGGATTYSLRLYDSTPTTLGDDEGNGKKLTVNNLVCHVNLIIRSGQTVSSLTFYPMLRLASIADDTYVPYAMTNKGLTNQKIDLYGLTSSTAVWQGDTLTFKITPNNGIMYHLIAMEAARQDTDKGTFCEAYIIMRAQGATAPNIRNRGTDNIIGTWDASSSSLIITLPKTTFWLYRFSVEALHASAKIL